MLLLLLLRVALLCCPAPQSASDPVVGPLAGTAARPILPQVIEGRAVNPAISICCRAPYDAPALVAITAGLTAAGPLNWLKARI